MTSGVFFGEVVGPLLGAGLIIINMLAHRQEFFTLAPMGGWATHSSIAPLDCGPGTASRHQRGWPPSADHAPGVP